MFKLAETCFWHTGFNRFKHSFGRNLPTLTSICQHTVATCKDSTSYPLHF